MLAGCGGGDPTATDPLKVLADGFVSHPGAVQIEAEGGTVIGGYDAWLVLRPAGPLTPRFDRAYAPIPCDEPAAFFSRLPVGAGLNASASSLKCRAYTDPRLSIPNGRWILEDQHAGRTWFRVWKGKPR